MKELNTVIDTVFGPSARPFFENLLQGLGVSPGASGTITSFIIPGLVAAALLVLITMWGRRSST